MKKRPNDVPHRRAFKKAHGRAPKPGYHIHHLDGNHKNNDPSNLVEVTPLEHYNIHKSQGDYGACVLLAKAANALPEELALIQQLHGKKCVEEKRGIHNEMWDRKQHIKQIWKDAPPGRKPVTNGVDILKFRTEEEVQAFLTKNEKWRKGYPDAFIQNWKTKSTRRISAEEAKELSTKRVEQGTHNFLIQTTCPHCGKIGKGPMMKRWHFANCKSK